MTWEGRLFSEDETRTLLSRDEGQFLEFKSLWDQEAGQPRALDRRRVRDTVAEYVAAFADADGGILLLGVEDDGRPTGHGYPEEAVADFITVPERRLRPQVRCRFDRIRIDGSEILVFDVPNAPEAVMVEANGFPYVSATRWCGNPRRLSTSGRRRIAGSGTNNGFDSKPRSAISIWSWRSGSSNPQPSGADPSKKCSIASGCFSPTRRGGA